MKEFSDRMTEVLEEIHSMIRDIDPDTDEFDSIVYAIRRLFRENLPEYPIDQVVDSTLKEED